MKSVCILNQNIYDEDVRVRRKAEALHAAGYKVDVLALQSSSNLRRYTLDGANIYTFPLRKKRGSKWRYSFEYLTFIFWAFFKLFILMRDRKYDLIDVNTLPDFLVFATLYPRWKGAKILLDMHEITPEFLMSKYGVPATHWQVRLVRFVERISISYADHVITINEPIQQLLEGRGLAPSKSTIIMNSADEAMFSAFLDQDDATSLTPKSANFVMMYHGTLTHIYGLDIAIEAFGIARKDMPSAEFWILGDGPEMASLEIVSRTLGMEGAVRFIGRVRPEEIPQWLVQCDVGVLPTRQDVFLDFSFSNKLSEYIVLGKAVIASRLRTIRYYFSEGALAYFEPNNPTDLAKQMTRMYEDRDLRVQLAIKAKQEYAPIRWEIMRQRYLKLVEDLT